MLQTVTVNPEASTPEDAPTLETWDRVRPSPADLSSRRLSQAELRAIAEQHGGPRVSLFLPTHAHGPQAKQDAVQLRSLRGEAQAELETIGVAATEIDGILGPVEALERQEEFWRSSTPGLAVLASPGGMQTFRLPGPAGPRSDVGERFEVLPLLPLLERDRFLVLAISRGQVRLHLGDRDSLHELPLPQDVPRSLPDFAGHQLERGTHQVHSVGGPGSPGGGAIHHGHGTGHDDRDAEHTQFVRAVVAGIARSEALRGLPVVVAAVERTVAEVREHPASLQLAPEAIVGNPSDRSLQGLHELAWGCLEPVFSADNERTIEAILGASATGAATELPVILTAARQGRVDTLVVADDGGEGVRATGPRPGTDEGLAGRWRADLEQALAHALTHGSKIVPVPPEQLPEGRVAAALLRY